MENQDYTPEIQSPALKWLDNFWYHYKWHTLIALFLIVAITICSVQACNKQSYDVFIMYAGAHDVERTASGSVSEFETLVENFKRITDDHDGDGERSPSFLPLFLPSNEEIDEINARDERFEVNTNVVADNAEIFRQNVIYSDYYICLLSRSVYETYRVTAGVEIFVPLADYVGDAEVSYFAPDAVLLSSTVFGALPALADFPEDTLICLRILSEVGASKGKNREVYADAEQTLRAIFAYS